jgi:hypothetical protein
MNDLDDLIEQQQSMLEVLKSAQLKLSQHDEFLKSMVASEFYKLIPKGALSIEIVGAVILALNDYRLKISSELRMLAECGDGFKQITSEAEAWRAVECFVKVYNEREGCAEFKAVQHV